MQNHLNEILYNTGEEVFENLAFVLTMPEGDGLDDFDMGDFEPVSFEEVESPEAYPGENDVEFDGDDTKVSCDETFEGLDVDLGKSSPEETLVASIHFRGVCEGSLFLETSARLLPVIGMNMLGLDDPNALSDEEEKDAFCELLNVICGNLLPAVAGEKRVFNIDGAEIHSDATIPETFDGKTSLADAHFGLEIGHAKLTLFADQKICQTQEASV